MSKTIKYLFCTEVNSGNEENLNIEQRFIGKTIPYSETNEEIAKKESYNGEYEIVDDGQPEPVAEPTTDDILNAILGVNV